jgi:hypothetical protein
MLCYWKMIQILLLDPDLVYHIRPIEHMSMFKTFLFLLLFHFIISSVDAQKFTLNGYVNEAATGENLTGATIIVENLPATGAVSNNYGFFSLSLPQGFYRIKVQFIGYEPLIVPVQLDDNFTLSIELKSAAYELGDIKVTGRQANRNVSSMDMGVVTLVPREIDEIPVIFGEQDIMKIIQLTPGVKPAGEGNSGFHVRGGGIDQNLILLDEAPVYNPSHLLGFFSVFNSEAIRQADLLKGAVPAEYGGRASSVLDIRMKEGNLKEFGATGKLGLISSSMTLEGPVVKDKSSFMLSGRRTYADMFLNLSSNADIRSSQLYFYDLNMKTNFRINAKNRVYFTGYMGRDEFNYRNNFRLDWGSIAGTFRWNHIFSKSVFSNTTLIYSKYASNITLVRDFDIQFRSVIEDLNLKQDFTYYMNSRNTMKFGFNIIDHTILPGRINLSGAFGIDPPENITERKALEGAVYISNDQQLTKKLRLYYGMRVSVFSNMGPGEFYKFNNRGELVNTISLDKPTFFHTSTGVEPRLGINYRMTQNSSWKASYTRIHQYLHLISNTTTSVPTDIWLPSSNNVKPQFSDQVSMGYFRNFFSNRYESSLEVYHKDLKNQIEYKNAAELVYNSTVESELTFGRGWAYGAEFMLKKNDGDLNGWISYTWSKTMRQFDDVNQGKPFPAQHDRTHDFSAVIMYDLINRLNLSAAWVYYTGNAVTMPSGKYQIERKTVSYYTERNGYRMPDYHRLDLSLVLHGKPRKGFESSWSLSIYNAYARENAYIIKFRNKADRPDEMEAVQVSLFKAVPSLSYRFKF